MKRAGTAGSFVIETLSSRPCHHPQEISRKIVDRIVSLRKQTNGRCSEVIHALLLREGIKISLSSVKRILKRRGLLKAKSPWKKYHQSGARPEAQKPGSLVEVDTIHLMQTQTQRIYIYTLLDVYSRWAFAEATGKIHTVRSVAFLQHAQRHSPFVFDCIQSDHGPEFSKQFSQKIHVRHRHSRVRKPNDNAHLERFNRTIQSEFLSRFSSLDVEQINEALPMYLEYYNKERLHLGLKLKTPAQVLRSY
jgi:transposase InsO family protein